MSADRDNADTFLVSGGALSGPLGQDLRFALESPPEGSPGARLGPYRILDEIGRGGMGAVYLAERADDEYRKRVAIKFGLRGPRSIHDDRRFRDERQILAGLEHVNIARLLDGGTSPGGLPFLVMEYVEGLPIDAYCDQRRLSIDDRLRLFRAVCAAVHYAHQRLVVHRDLKPSNVMVTGDGSPKLLDFGIAKLLTPDGQLAAAQTATADRVFTPEYASPEQVRGAAVTTATDVYQLGVLLYRLLAGRRPYRVSSGLPHELAAAICDQEPERPSTAIARDDAAEIVAARDSSPDRLRRRLRGDLDAIVLMALNKAPERRYGSVEQMSDDIERHLTGLPVAARAGSEAYRAGRFLWRHRVAAGGIAVIIAALTAGLAVASWQARVAQRERIRAEAQESSNRRLLYAAQMNMAGQEWTSANLPRARSLLDTQVPADGREDLRGFEWYHLWKATHSERRTFPGAALAMALSPDRRWLATSDDAERPVLHVWDVDSGRHLSAYDGHGDIVNAIDVSPDGTMLVSASDDATARLWRVGTAAPLATMAGHTGSVYSARFDPAGARVATASADGTTKIWDLQGRPLAVLDRGAGAMRAVAFSRDGRWLATGGDEGAVTVWDARTLARVDRLHDRRPGQIVALAFSPDGRYLASTGTAYGGIAVWDLPSRQLLPLNHTSSQFCAAFSPDGELLATGGHDRLVLLWQLRTGRLVNIIRGHGDAVDAVQFSADGRTLVSGSRDGSIRHWDVDVPQASKNLYPGGPMRAVALSRDGARLAVAGLDAVRLLDVSTGRELASYQVGAANALAFALDGRTLAVLDDRSAVHVLDVADGKTVVVLEGRHPAPPLHHSAALAFSLDGRRLAAAAGDTRVRVWSVGDWQESAFDAGVDVVNAVAFSPDGRRLATAGMHRTARIHDLSGQQPPLALVGHTRLMLWTAFTPDGTRVVTSSVDGTVRFWDAKTGAELTRITRGGDLGLGVLTPDNRRLLVAGIGDPSIAIFDSTSGDLLMTLRGHMAPVSAVAISQDGTLIASSSNNGQVRLWQAATANEIDEWQRRSRPAADLARGSRD